MTAVAAELDATFGTLLKQVQALSAENDRLKNQQAATWRVKSERNELASKLREQEKALAKLREEAGRLRQDNYFWRRAVRYEQCLKKPRKQVRHLPPYMQVKRADRRERYDLKIWGPCPNRERIFLRRWRAENRRQPGLNGGHGVLELILSENSNDHAAGITQRDATVAASVIQWLGTNCGQAFLYEVQREIEQAKKPAAVKAQA